MKLTLSVDSPGKSFWGLAVAVQPRCVGLALVSKVINLRCSCSLSFVLQIAQAVKNGCARASASPALREGTEIGAVKVRQNGPFQHHSPSWPAGSQIPGSDPSLGCGAFQSCFACSR